MACCFIQTCRSCWQHTASGKFALSRVSQHLVKELPVLPVGRKKCELFPPLGTEATRTSIGCGPILSSEFLLLPVLGQYPRYSDLPLNLGRPHGLACVLAAASKIDLDLLRFRFRPESVKKAVNLDSLSEPWKHFGMLSRKLAATVAPWEKDPWPCGNVV